MVHNIGPDRNISNSSQRTNLSDFFFDLLTFALKPLVDQSFLLSCEILLDGLIYNLLHLWFVEDFFQLFWSSLDFSCSISMRLWFLSEMSQPLTTEVPWNLDIHVPIRITVIHPWFLNLSCSTTMRSNTLVYDRIFNDIHTQPQCLVLLSKW